MHHDNRPQKGSHRRARADNWLVPTISISLVAITWLVFGQTLGHEFLNYDDNKYVYENAQISRGLSGHGILWAFTHTYANNWHPLTTISHMLDCQLYGLKPGGHHFTNVFLHTIAVILLFFVCWQMTGGPSRTGNLWRSAFVAALFAIHPLHVESVAWIAERKDVLSGVFFMLTLGAYVRYVRKPSPARYVTMSILFALGLLSKPMLVTVPFVLLLLDYWPLQRIADSRNLRGIILEKIPLLALSAASCLATTLAQGKAIVSLADEPIYWRIGNAFLAVIIYLRQFFWPMKLAVFYPHPLHQLVAWQVAFSIAFVIGISIGAIIIGQKRGYVPVGWFWFLGMLVPVLGIVQVGLQGHADRYTYLPYIGLSLLVTWGIVDLAARWRYRRQILGVGASIVIAALVWRAQIETKVWRNTETLWTHALAVTANNHMAHVALGNISLSRGRLGEAIAHCEKALAIYPDDVEEHNKMGLALSRAGNPSAAIAHWKIALQIDPHHFKTEANLAWVFSASPDASVRSGVRAVELAQDAIQRSGNRNAIILRTLAAAYAECGQFSEAIRTAQEALDLAVVQGNSDLIADLHSNIDNYKMNFPLRDASLANGRPSP